MNGLVKAGLSFIGLAAVGLGLNKLDKRLRYKADGYNRMVPIQ